VTLIGRAAEVKERKVVVVTDLIVDGEVTARGYAVLVKLPERIVDPLANP